jgi:hypothetical protein
VVRASGKAPKVRKPTPLARLTGLVRRR